MERSPSVGIVPPPSEEQRNGSIFRRMYNSLHRPKKGSDPLVDLAEKFEQERIREQRKSEVQHRPDNGKQKQHKTISGAEKEREPHEAMPKYQSWKGDIKSNFEWEPPKTMTTASLPTVTPTSLAPSASESYISLSHKLPQPTTSLSNSTSQRNAPTFPRSASISPTPVSPRSTLTSSTTISPRSATSPPSVSPPRGVPPSPRSIVSSSSPPQTLSPTQSSSKPKLTRGHALTTSSVSLPGSSPPSTHKIKRFSLRSESFPSSSPTPTTTPPAPPEADSKPLSSRSEKTRSAPPKQPINFKEFRPEKKEKVDVDQLRLSYEAQTAAKEPGPIKGKSNNEHAKRNPSRNGAGPDKPMNGVVSTIASSRLPSTMLPGLQLLPTDEVRKFPLDRPRHPYIPKKETGVWGTLRQSSSGKYSPKKPSPKRKESPTPPPPPPTSTSPEPSTPWKVPSLPLKQINKDTTTEGEQARSISPRFGHYELPRSQTETLSGVYNNPLRRQRSHHISNSPPPASRFILDTQGKSSNSPREERPLSPSSLVQSDAMDIKVEGRASIRRVKHRHKDTSSRSSTKSRALESKKMKQQVVTAKDLAAFSSSPDGKLKLETMFEQPEGKGRNTRSPGAQRSLSPSSPKSTPTSSVSPLSTSPSVSSTTSSSAPISNSATTSTSAPSSARKLSSVSTPAYAPQPSSKVSSNTTANDAPLSPSKNSPPGASPSPNSSPSPTPDISAPAPTIPIATPTSPPYPKPPYMLTKSGSISPKPLASAENSETSSAPRS